MTAPSTARSGVVAAPTHLDIAVVSLFPEMFMALTGYGVAGRAVARGLVRLQRWNPREFTRDAHRTVDDRPYGGGPGMVMLYAPLRDAILAAKQDLGAAAWVVVMTPQGRQLNQAGVAALLARQRLVIVAGRYEGMDERVIEGMADEECSIGDYVLSGGELAAMVLIDAMVRLVPGAVGDADSVRQDSFCAGLLDHPHYTRPETVDGLAVPAVLLSGNHAAIRRWRLQQSLGRTGERRPDLLGALNAEQQRLVQEYMDEKRRPLGDGNDKGD